MAQKKKSKTLDTQEKDISLFDLFNAITSHSRSAKTLDAEAIEEDLRYFLRAAEFNGVAQFDNALVTARGLVIQESYLDIPAADTSRILAANNSLSWQMAALQICDRIAKEGSDLESYTLKLTEAEAERELNITRILEPKAA